MTSASDDRRYMTFEMRAADDPRYRGQIEKRAEGTVTCYCGKTVYRHNGRKVSESCPRDCESHRENPCPVNCGMSYCDCQESV